MARKVRNGKYVEYEKIILKELIYTYNKIKEDHIGIKNDYERQDIVDMLQLWIIRDKIPTSSFSDVLKILKSEDLITEIVPSLKQFEDHFDFLPSESKAILQFAASKFRGTRRFFFLTQIGYVFAQKLSD